MCEVTGVCVCVCGGDGSLCDKKNCVKLFMSGLRRRGGWSGEGGGSGLSRVELI